MSYNLLTYKEARIEALLQRNKELELENEKLTTFIFELCDKDCPEEYKKIVQSDVFKG
jgi:cell division septum initiation protein DivIVA